MTINRYSKRRDPNEAAIVAALRNAGAYVHLLDLPLDLLVGYQGRTYLLEVKLPLGPRGGERTEWKPSQREFLAAWPGGVAQVVRTPAEALDVIGVEVAS